MRGWLAGWRTAGGRGRWRAARGGRTDVRESWRMTTFLRARGVRDEEVGQGGGHAWEQQLGRGEGMWESWLHQTDGQDGA